jgi:GT2 family glycosyltransferase
VTDAPSTMAIGVCTYNRGRAIVRTLEALARLDTVEGRVRRVLIVDNRSSDDTAAAVDDFLARRPRGAAPMRRVHEPRPGKVNAMLRFFAETDEPYLGVIDDDTLPDPGWARGMISLLDEKERAGVVGGPVLNVWESGPTRLARIYRRSLGDQVLSEQRERLDDPAGFLMGASMTIRRRALEESGWMGGSWMASRTGESLECGAEDAELCYRIRRAGWELWYEPQARMGHLIPARRQTPEYLARLREGITRGEPGLRWVAGLVGSAREAAAEAARARRLYTKTLLFDWRPTRRRVRLAERRGRMQGWAELAARLNGGSEHADAGPA